MQKTCELTIGTQTISYLYRKRRGQKRLTLSVRADGRITLSVPWWVSQHAAERFIHSKRTWLAEVLSRVPPLPAGEGGVRGRAGWGEGLHASIAQYKQHKEAARAFIHRRLAELNAHYGFSWGRVAIRKNASCWGSCSSKRNLNFDYRILFLPPHLQDYILVHELCHLREMNHSPRFWALVAHTVPAYKECRAELRVVRR